MKQYGGMLVVGVLAVCVGFAISMQISLGQNPDQGGLVPIGKVTPYQAELEKLQLEKDQAIEELRVIEERLARIEMENAEDDTLVAGLVADLDRYKMAAGVLDVKGPGLIITIEDPPPIEGAETDAYGDIMTHFDLMLSLVNRLKEAGAEAISINGNRLVNLTEMVLAGDNVNINSNPTASPYTLLVIGDPDTMESAITIKFGIVSTMRDMYSLRVSIEKSQEIAIARYNGSVTNFRYAQPVTETGAS
ncbi:MAG: DUF881 domain-containing protein [Clostridiales Family XIII bacterium]|jgi:uncharacterized protein YlxW (UPF0749 family)|nr:DUF881 domain-containing protein [Clostridiales Family XIII bacterium]